MSDSELFRMGIYHGMLSTVNIVILSAVYTGFTSTLLGRGTPIRAATGGEGRSSSVSRKGEESTIER